MKTYCTGYRHQKCDSCQHQANWHTLNQMPNSLRLQMQKQMVSIEIDRCRLTKMGDFVECANREG